jgi:membrane protein YqaA with SNARE-associated domain
VDKLEAWLEAWGLAGVLLIAALDSAGIPLPAGVDALLVALAVVSPHDAFAAALLATAGSVAGNLALFLAARKGGEAWLEKRTPSGRARRFRDWFRRYGLITVFVPAVVPVVPLPMKVFVISAGALGVRVRSFLLTVLAARVPRYVAMAWLGTQLGRGTTAWLEAHLPYLAMGAVLLFVALFLAVRYAELRSRRRMAAVE